MIQVITRVLVGASCGTTTSFRVVTPYGDLGLARIADSPAAFIAAVEDSLTETAERAARRRDWADVYLSDLSWDRTWTEMSALVKQATEGRTARV